MRRFCSVALALSSACAIRPTTVNPTSIGSILNMSIDSKVTDLGCPRGISPVPIQKVASDPIGIGFFPQVADDQGRSLFFTKDHSIAKPPAVRPGGMLLVVRGAEKLSRPINAVFGESVQIDGATFGSGRFVAVGTDNGLAIWDSPDGAAWAKVAQFPSVTSVLTANIAFGPSGWLVLVKREDFQVIALRSSNGKRWNEQIRTPLGGVNGLAGNGAAFVVVSDTSSELGELTTSQAIIWSSSDGLSWRKVMESPRTGISDIAASSSGFFASGFAGPAPAVWLSGDGLRWRQVRGCPGQGTTGSRDLRTITISKNSVVAAGRGHVVMVSPDGSSWRQAKIALSGKSLSEIDFVAAVSQGNDLFLSLGYDVPSGHGPGNLLGKVNLRDLLGSSR